MYCGSIQKILPRSNAPLRWRQSAVNFQRISKPTFTHVMLARHFQTYVLLIQDFTEAMKMTIRIGVFLILLLATFLLCIGLF